MDHTPLSKSSCDNGATARTDQGTGLQIGEVYQLADLGGNYMDGWFYLPRLMAAGMWSPQEATAKPEPQQTSK
jgi:hypothetical protein